MQEISGIKETNIPVSFTDQSPEPGSVAERLLFKKLQDNFPSQFATIFPDKLAPRTVVIIPSLTMDQEILSKISGINHYEERMLCMLMLLRMPRTHVIYVTSETIDPVIVDYYLHMLPGVTGYHALRRLTLLSCHDSSSKPLTQKILERPRIIKRIKDFIPPEHEAHMSCFNVTEYERRLAVQLQIPVYGCDPDLYELGSKSNGRKIFRDCGLNVPDGYEDLHTPDDIINALAKLKTKYPQMRKAVVKVNDGFSGDGNAIFYFKGLDKTHTLPVWIKENFQHNLQLVATDLSYEMFLKKYQEMGGIVEEFIEARPDDTVGRGEIKTSPSVQCRVTPTGHCEIISTHDQELGGETGQVYLGAHFPASKEYAIELGKMGLQVAEILKTKGVIGRFAIDFISVKNNHEWKHFPIEINLRKGGTTHPFLMLQFLTDGIYNPEEGMYYTSQGHLVRYYFCSDNLKSKKYLGLTPHDLIDIAMINDIHFDGTSQEGIMFHLIGALSQYGKLGVVCIGSSQKKAKMYYDKIVAVLEKECH